jgi:hypothetical protein
VLLATVCAIPVVQARASDDTSLNPFVVYGNYENTIAGLLFDAPSWWSESSPETRTFILHRYFEISLRKTAEIREGVVDFLSLVDKANFDPGRRNEEYAKVLLLNRMIFAIPVFTEATAMRSQDLGWIPKPGPALGSFVWSSAPLAVDADGAIAIGASLKEIGSPPNVYFPGVLHQFDAMEKKFGRSTLRMDKLGRIFRSPSGIPEQLISKSNHSPDPTPASITPAAGQPPR